MPPKNDPEKNTPGFKDAEEVIDPAAKTVKAICKVDLFIEGKPFNKDQEVMVTPRQFAALGRKLAKVAALLAFLLTLADLNVNAAPPGTYGSLPFTMPATNETAASTNNYVPTSTTVPGLTYWTNLISMAKFDEVSLTITGQEPTGTAGFTNTLLIYGCNDTTYFDTNHVIATCVLSCVAGYSNAVLVTNLSRNLIGSVGYLFIGQIQAPTGNASTAINLVPYFKPVRAGQ